MLLFLVGFLVFVCAVLWNEWKHNDHGKIMDKLITLERIMTSSEAANRTAITQLQDKCDATDKALLQNADWQKVIEGRVRQADDLAHRANIELSKIPKTSLGGGSTQKVLVEFSPVPLLVKHKEIVTPAANRGDEKKKLFDKTKKQIKELSN